MDNSVPLRWIAEAEARSVCDAARLRQAELSPNDGLPHPRLIGRGWLQCLLQLVPGLVWGELTEDVDRKRVLVTVLITDIVDSTKLVAKVGDRHWRALLDRHDAMVRQQFNRFRGREIKHTGDGFLATFGGPARAVHCASAITRTVQPIGIEVRAGLHTGEIEFLGDDIAGMAVNIAARVAAMAGPNETLVSSTVRDLVAGSCLRFDDRGFHELKGLPERMRLFKAL